MISRAGRIHASTLQDAIEQIPLDVTEYRIWAVYPTETGWWFEWRGWAKER